MARRSRSTCRSKYGARVGQTWNVICSGKGFIALRPETVAARQHAERALHAKHAELVRASPELMERARALLRAELEERGLDPEDYLDE